MSLWVGSHQARTIFFVDQGSHSSSRSLKTSRIPHRVLIPFYLQAHFLGDFIRNTRARRMHEGYLAHFLGFLPVLEGCSMSPLMPQSWQPTHPFSTFHFNQDSCAFVDFIHFYFLSLPSMIGFCSYKKKKKRLINQQSNPHPY